MRTELFINGTYVDISNDVAIALTYAVSDLKQPDKRQGSFSKTVTLPGTKQIVSLLGHIFDVNLSIQNVSTTNFNPDFNPNLKADIVVTCDLVEQFRGYMRLRNIHRSTSNLSLLSYDVELYGELANIFNKLGDAKLTDLDFSEFNHTYNRTVQKASWTVNKDTGYYYPMIQYGQNNGSTWDVNDFYPGIYLYQYLKKIFQYAGYTWSSASLEANPFTKLIVPFNKTALQLTSSQVLSRLFSASLSGNQTNTTAVGSLSSFYPVIFDAESSDVSNQYDTGTGIFTAANTGYYDFINTLEVKAVANGAITGGSYNFTPFINVVLMKNGSTQVMNLTTYPVVNSGSGSPYLNGDVLFDHTMTTSSQPIYLVAGETIQVWVGVWLTSTGLTGNADVSINAGSTFINRISNPVMLEGGTVDMNGAVPEDIRMADFLLAIIKDFNLMVEPNRSLANQLIIEPASTFYASGTTRDWTGKLDVSKEFLITPMGALDARRYTLRHKEDSDFYNARSKRTWGKVYGEKNHDVGNDFLQNENVYESLFSPTPLVNNGVDDRVYPYIYAVDSNGNATPQVSNIRLLYAGGAISTGYTWTYQTLSGNFTETTYPYAGHLDSVSSPTRDFNFTVPKEVYYNALTYTDGNLWNRYHKQFIEEITNKNSKIVTAWFYLDAVDILQLSFKDKIFVDNCYYRLQRVIDYDPTKRQSTKVELLKIISNSPFVAGTYSFNPSDSAVIGSDVAPRIIGNVTPRGINAGSILAGRNNSVSDTSESSLIAGFRNMIGNNCSDIVIAGGSGNTVAPYLRNVSLINTNDIVVTESNVTYINGVKQPSGSITNVTTSQTITGAGIYQCTGSLTLTLSTSVLTVGSIVQIYNMGTGTLTIAGGGVNILYAPSGSSATITSTNRYESITLMYNGTNYIVE